MSNLRFAVFGAGFWANFQLAGWKELDGLECVAVCDPTRSKVDFVDIITDVGTHAQITRMAAERGLNVVC